MRSRGKIRDRNVKRFGLLNALRQSGERRGFPRADDPRMPVVIEGRTYLTRNWTISGFWIDDYASPVKPGYRLSGALSGPAASTRGEFVAEVAWADERRNIGLRLLELDGVRIT